MPHRDNNGLGKIIYTEWLIPLFDYYFTLSFPVIVYEVIIPFVIGFVCTAVYYLTNNVAYASAKLAELLPNVIAILIGFTFTFITLILTTSSPSMEKIRKKRTRKKLRNKTISLFQLLHIQFTHSLLTEIILLLSVFLYLFISKLISWIYLDSFFLFIDVTLLLNILLSILRGMTNLYFSFYND